MSEMKPGPRNRPGGQLPRKRKKNTFITKSGNAIKINRGLTARLKARQAEKARRKAERLAGMPKSRVKRFFYRLHPKRMYKYWFSREGLIMGLKIAGIGILAGFLILVGVFAYFRKDLPNLKDLSLDKMGGSIRYYDRTGQTLLWEDYDAVKRIPIKDEDMGQFIKDATIAIEDKDFFKHGGFDVRGIARAGWNNVFGNGGTQGGSTITQQLVKLTQDWSRDRTYTRKVKELILSVELERSYTKKEILAGYLNTAPYGSIDYGVEAASKDYFNKSAKDLTLDEAAFLAAIPKSPTYYSPYSPAYSKEALIGRQHYILDQMLEQKMIKKEQRDEAKKIDTIAKVKPRKPKYDNIKAPWFVLTAKEQLEYRFGGETVRRGGWKVITTLDLPLQGIAEEEVSKGLAQVRRQGGDVAAFAAEDVKTGQVVALVGGADFNNPEYGQNNYARYRLPPGSSFKPYDYISLMENTTNTGAGSVLYDTQGPLEGYPCTNKALPKNGGNCLQNYDFRYPGPVTLRYALGGSRNVPAVKAMLIAGIDKTINTAHSLMTTYKDGKIDPNVGSYKCYADEQFTTESQCYASAAIGDGAYLKLDENVHGYATISRNGLNLPQTYILKIEDSQGKVVDEWKPSKGDQAVRPDSAYIVADMLSDPNASYFPAARKPHRYKDWKFGMKTGTTNDGKDGWMMGFSTQYAAGVWVGYHNRQKVMSGTMENMTQPIWQGWMRRAHDGKPAEERVKPASVQTLPAYVIRNHVGIGSVEPSPSNDLFPSWYQQAKKSTGAKRVIDIISNKLATDCTPQRARKEVSDADANTFSASDRYANPGGNANTEDKDDVHKCDDLKPAIRLTVDDQGGGTYRLTADVTQGTHPLSSEQYPGTVNFIVDGQILPGGSFNISSNGIVSMNYTPSFSGSKEVTAQIIDSVLYEASDTGTVTGSGGSQSTIRNFTATVKSGGTKVSFSWDDVDGASSYELCYQQTAPAAGPELCNDYSDSETGNIDVVPGGEYSATLNVNGASETISFST